MNHILVRPEWPASPNSARTAPAPPSSRQNVTAAVLAGVLAFIVAGVVAVIVMASGSAVIAGSAVAAGPTSIRVEGQLDLYQAPRYSSYTVHSGTCSGLSGYDDIHAGAAVTVRGAAGQVIGTGRLESGNPGTGYCSFPFTITGITIAEDFYSVEVSHRGELTFSASEIKGDSLYVGATLGL